MHAFANVTKKVKSKVRQSQKFESKATCHLLHLPVGKFLHRTCRTCRSQRTSWASLRWRGSRYHARQSACRCVRPLRRGWRAPFAGWELWTWPVMLRQSEFDWTQHVPAIDASLLVLTPARGDQYGANKAIGQRSPSLENCMFVRCPQLQMSTRNSPVTNLLPFSPPHFALLYVRVF